MPGAPVQLQGRILHVDMINSIGEFAEEAHRINYLPMQMAGIEVEPESLPIIKYGKRAFCRDDIKINLCRMNF